MKEQFSIRVKALAWLQEGSNLFVVKMHDSVKGDDYYRPIGGSVEFGESTRQALRREVMEEIGTGIKIIAEPLILENLFTCDGVIGHEIVYIYPAKFIDPEFTKNRVFQLIEANGEVFEAAWINVSRFLDGELRLVPEQLIEWCKKID